MSKSIQTLPKARLMLLFVVTTPIDTDTFTQKEKALMEQFKKCAYSGTGISCRSEDEARNLLRSYITPGAGLNVHLVVSYPTIWPVSLLRLYARGDYIIGIFKTYFQAGTKAEARQQDEKYYFVFDLQPLQYSGLAKKIFEAGP